MKKCFYCDEEIKEPDEKYMMIAVEIPYINLFFHKDSCYLKIKDNLNTYIRKNSEKVCVLSENYIIEKMKKTKRK